MGRRERLLWGDIVEKVIPERPIGRVSKDE